MKKLRTTIFMLLIAQLAMSQSPFRYYDYDGAGNRILRTSEIVAGGCPTTLTGYTNLGEDNGHGYYMSDASMNWAGAKAQAVADGGYLVTINNQNENDFVMAGLNSNMVFIGFTDEINEDFPEWANNEPVTLDLSYGDSDINDYAVMNFWAGTWQMVNQWVSKKYIMEMDCGTGGGPTGDLTITCPEDINVTTSTYSAIVTWDDAIAVTSCSVNSNVTVTQTGGPASGTEFLVSEPITITYEATDNCNNNHTCSFVVNVTAEPTGGCGAIAGFTLLGEYLGQGYYMSDGSSQWAQAKTLAENAGGYLATMTTTGENDFLKSQLGSNMVFIGFSDKINEGSPNWVNNETVTIDLSYDNSDINDYAVMNFWAGTWQMVNQWVSKKFVMEKGCSGVPNPTPTTVSEIGVGSEMLIFPNPTDGMIFIESSDKLVDSRVYIYNSQGSLVLERQLEDGRFNMSNFSDGVYSVVLRSRHRNYYVRIVKIN